MAIGAKTPLAALLADLIIPERLRAEHARGLARYLATGEGPVLGKRIEMPAMRADGTEFTAELSIVRITTDGCAAVYRVSA